MAVIESPYKSSVVIKLNGGINPATGGVITKNTPINGLAAGADGDKIWAIVSDFLPIATYPFVNCRRTEITTIEP